MANVNKIIIVGRLTADPTGRVTTDGNPMAEFKLSVNRPFVTQSEDNVDLIDVVAWRKLAEVCSQHLKKGQLVLVEGRIRNRSFDDQAGQRQWVTEVVANNMTMLERAASAAKSPASFNDAEPAMDDMELAGDLPS